MTAGSFRKDTPENTMKPTATHLSTFILFTVLLAPLGLFGCNTTAGIGEDIEAAGGAIEGKAEQTKPYD
jgi:predicted small secreted protein